MPPSIIECAADLSNVENCSSNIVFGDQRIRMTESEIQPKSSGSSSQDSGRGRNTPRFSLRKRNTTDDQRGEIISSYNSDFLSGIFADIAKATSSDDRDSSFPETQPSKKSRLSLTKSISRCGRSYANLAAVSPTPEQGRRFLHVRLPGAADAPKTQRASQQDLHHCVSSTSNDENSHFAKLAFPQLPSSVKDTSSFTLTPTNKDQQTSDSEMPSKDHYGWFVEMDDECTGLSVNAYNNTSQKNLAFLAPTAPKGVDQDAEVEWAKAADTVDDVLGDFF
jgi:hypothetical protein